MKNSKRKSCCLPLIAHMPVTCGWSCFKILSLERIIWLRSWRYVENTLTICSPPSLKNVIPSTTNWYNLYVSAIEISFELLSEDMHTNNNNLKMLNTRAFSLMRKPSVPLRVILQVEIRVLYWKGPFDGRSIQGMYIITYSWGENLHHVGVVKPSATS